MLHRTLQGCGGTLVHSAECQVQDGVHVHHGTGASLHLQWQATHGMGIVLEDGDLTRVLQSIAGLFVVLAKM